MNPLMLLPLAFFFQTPPTYSIAGTLVNSVTGAPVVKAHISIVGLNGFGTTGPQGQFRFRGLRPGKYTLRAERMGYVSQTYGQRTLYGTGSTGIVVGEHESTENLAFRMIPSAVIAGFVKDSGGEPAVGMTVRVIRMVGIGMGRRASKLVSTTTDDRGHYRIASLAAGTYAVVVGGSPWHSQEIASVDPVAYPATFYPGTTDPAAARFLPLTPGQEASADLTIHAVPAVMIEGDASLVADPRAKLYAVLSSAPAFFGSRIAIGEATPVIDGKFKLQNVPLGSYRALVLRQADESQPATQSVGMADIQVTAEPATVVINETPPKIAVRLNVVGKPRSLASPLLAGLKSLDDPASAWLPVGPDGSAIFPTAPSRRYIVRAMQGRPLAVTSLKATGAALSGLAVDIPETGLVQIEATVDTATVTVSGRLLRDGAPQPGMIVLLANRDSWQQTGYYQADQTSTNGGFTLSDLPPGEYLAFALEQGEPEDYADADSIRALLPIAQPLTVPGEGLTNVELKLLPLPAAK